MKISLIVALLAAAGGIALPASARMLDPAKPEDAVEINRRTQCGVGDQPAVYHWSGRVYSLSLIHI